MKDDTQFIRIWEGKYIMIDAIQINKSKINKNCSASDFLEKLSDKEHNRLILSAVTITAYFSVLRAISNVP